jgi:hypothetical protein
MRKYNINVKTALAVFAIVLSACSSDNDIVNNNSNNQEKPVTNKTMSFRASMDGETTRTDFNGNSTIWSEKDAISILNTASVPEETKRPTQADFTISKGVGTKEATFTGGPIRANGNNADNFYAFYPATTLSTSDNDIKASASVPTVQTATDGTYDQSLHFMSAYSTNATFNFKNVCSLIKITLTNNTSVCRVKVVANPTLTNVYDQQFNYTSITGNFDATIGSDGIASVTATDAKSTYVELRAKGDDGTAKKVIGNGTFYMVVLPANITNGFTLLFEKTNGTIYQRISTKVTKFERNKMYDLGSFDCSGTPNGMTELTNVVDLDLPSGTIWATKNLNSKNGLLSDPVILGFTSSETDYGGYFSFGKESVWAVGGYGASKPGLDESTLKNAYDPAYSYASFNQKYCMPIYAQMYEFYNHFSNDYKQSFISRTLGVATDGYAVFTAPTGTGRTITLPYTGHYMGASIRKDHYTHISYWSRTAQDQGANLNPLDWASSYCLETEEKTVNGKKVPEQVNAGGGSNAWVDDAYTGRAIRPVATNIKIAPIK